MGIAEKTVRVQVLGRSGKEFIKGGVEISQDVSVSPSLSLSLSLTCLFLNSNLCGGKGSFVRRMLLYWMCRVSAVLCRMVFCGCFLGHSLLFIQSSG